MPHICGNRPTPDFLAHFEAMENPRQQAKIRYPLEEILLLVLCAVTLGAQGLDVHCPLR